jgi:hypothetical protein
MSLNFRELIKLWNKYYDKLSLNVNKINEYNKVICKIKDDDCNFTASELYCLFDLIELIVQEISGTSFEDYEELNLCCSIMFYLEKQSCDKENCDKENCDKEETCDKEKNCDEK